MTTTRHRVVVNGVRRRVSRNDQFLRVANTYAATAEEFSRILNEYRELWRDIDSYRVTEDDATERLRALKARSVATRPLLKSRVNTRVLMQCHEAAAQVVRHA